MHRSIVSCFLFLLMTICGCPQTPREQLTTPHLTTIAKDALCPVWQEIIAFEGRKLNELGEKESIYLSNLLKPLRMEDKQKLCYAWEPWLLVPLLNDSGEIRHVLVFIRPYESHPGTSAAAIYVFDSKGNLLTDCQFSTGYRERAVNAEKIKVLDNNNVILIKTKAWSGGNINCYQYYALAGDKIILVRLEGSKRTLTDNKYVYPQQTIGPHIFDFNEAKLLYRLINGSWAEKLGVLTWLGGWHLDKSQNFYSGDKNEVDLVKKSLKNNNIIAQIRKLSVSKDRWVNEAAQAVLDKLEMEE